MRKSVLKVDKVKKGIISVRARDARIGEVVLIEKRNGLTVSGSVLNFDGERVAIQVFAGTSGINTGDVVTFTQKQVSLPLSDEIIGRSFTALGKPRDGGPSPTGQDTPVHPQSFNPVQRVVPKQMVRTNVPMIDVFNSLVRSQKLPIFSVAGEPYNELLRRIANQCDADVVVIGGMSLNYDEYEKFIINAEESGSVEKTVMFTHLATDEAVECTLVPDMCIATAKHFANQGKDVLVLLTDMTAFADALKEVQITNDAIAVIRGYTGSVYSDLACRYEAAVDIDGAGSITIIAVTTMPGDDVTHPVPDNTGYITEGQFYLRNGCIEPFGSLSRLKQNVNKNTRVDHQQIMSIMIRYYGEALKTQEKLKMGFKLNNWDQKLLRYYDMFQSQIMNLEVNISLEEALDRCWDILAACFDKEEVPMKDSLIQEFWPQETRA